MRRDERQRWHTIASRIGVVAAPAGLNFVTPGTTFWLYSAPRNEDLRVGTRGFAFRSTDVRVAPSAEGIESHLAALRIVDALWEQRAPRLPLRTPRWLASRLAAAVASAEFDWRRFLVRSAAVLDRLRLVPEYHPRGEQGLSYLSDFVENGVTFLIVERIARV
jgi:hypothetical protein